MSDAEAWCHGKPGNGYTWYSKPRFIGTSAWWQYRPEKYDPTKMPECGDQNPHAAHPFSPPDPLCPCEHCQQSFQDTTVGHRNAPPEQEESGSTLA